MTNEEAIDQLNYIINIANAKLDDATPPVIQTACTMAITALKNQGTRVLEFSENHKPDYNKIGHGLRRIINQMFEFDDRIPRECFSVEDLTALQEAENLMYVLDYETTKNR